MGGNGYFEYRHQIFISSLIDLKFCTQLEGDNTQNRGGAIFEFPPPKNLAPL